MRRGLALLALVSCVLVPACDDDGDPVRPADPIPLTLETVWPDDDGLQWTFDLVQRDWRLGPENAPDSMTVSDVGARLEAAIPGEPAVTLGVWQLAFDDSVTTGAGVRAPYLRERLFEVQGFARGAVEVRPRPWPERLLAMRRARGGLERALPYPVEPPQLLPGYAWSKTDEHIGLYGDFDEQLAWKYLDAELQPGHGFDFELLPGLEQEPPLVLHVQMAGKAAIDTDLGRFTDAVQADYLVDHGELEAVDEGGEVVGTFRSVLFGRIVYVAGVGPVAVHERVVLTEDTVTNHGVLVFERELTILSVRQTRP